MRFAFTLVRTDHIRAEQVSVFYEVLLKVRRRINGIVSQFLFMLFYAFATLACLSYFYSETFTEFLASARGSPF